ncbi:MAG TPA: hypothetical protein VLK36_10345 [Gaiellaceae bacterium]|nr:hypothetical protein [Gaiellaceae bacterium]
MAVAEFQKLIDWCADESASPRRQHVAGALVYHYRGARAHGAWNGFLTCAGETPSGVDARFEGSLPAIASGTDDSGALDLVISVAGDRAWAQLSVEGLDVELPLVNLLSHNGVLEAEFDTGSPDHRFRYFGDRAYHSG